MVSRNLCFSLFPISIEVAVHCNSFWCAFHGSNLILPSCFVKPLYFVPATLPSEVDAIALHARLDPLISIMLFVAMPAPSALTILALSFKHF